MRFSNSILIVLLAFIACSVPPRKGFEPEHLQGDLTSGIPPGWRLRGPRPAVLPQGIDVYLDGGVKHSGRLSASLVATDAINRQFASLEQDFIADTYRGKRVRFSGYVKTNRVYGWTGLVMRVDSEGSHSIAADDMADRSISGTVDWTLCSVVLDIEEHAAVISIGVALHGEGQVWLDDCMVEVVDQSVESTDQFPNSYDRVTVIPFDIDPEPTNLDFEAVLFGG